MAYNKDVGAVLLKGKNFRVTEPGVPSAEECARLIGATDEKGKRLGDEWYTSPAVEDALQKYKDASEGARAEVIAILRDLAEQLLDRLAAITSVAVFS
eukprot:jgi/Mesen1/10048/ME000073S09326